MDDSKLEIFCSVIISFWEYSSFCFIFVVEKLVNIEVGKSVNILLYKVVGISVDRTEDIILFIAVEFVLDILYELFLYIIAGN